MALQHKGYPEEFWLHVAQQCLYYGILYHQSYPLQRQRRFFATSDEMVRCCVDEEMLFSKAISTGNNTLNVENMP
jgi:hypothetical protein